MDGLGVHALVLGVGIGMPFGARFVTRFVCKLAVLEVLVRAWRLACLVVSLACIGS